MREYDDLVVIEQICFSFFSSARMTLYRNIDITIYIYILSVDDNIYIYIYIMQSSSNELSTLVSGKV